MATGYNGKDILPDLRTHQIEANTWAIFECRGVIPSAIQKMWKRIYSEFFPTSEYTAKNEIDFEVYPEGDMNSPDYVCEIWIAVEKR